MFMAHAVNVRTESDSSKPFATALLAAQHLDLLLRLDGWSLDTTTTVAQLLKGATLTHRNYAYRVTE